jgi:hypothetical protein
VVDPRCPGCLRGLADMGDDVLAKLADGCAHKGLCCARWSSLYCHLCQR